jgi:hypothetical protein
LTCAVTRNLQDKFWVFLDWDLGINKLRESQVIRQMESLRVVVNKPEHHVIFSKQKRRVFILWTSGMSYSQQRKR